MVPVEPVVTVPSSQTPVHQQNQAAAANENRSFTPADFFFFSLLGRAQPITRDPLAHLTLFLAGDSQSDALQHT